MNTVKMTMARKQLSGKDMLTVFMKIRETVMRHIGAGITQEKKDAAVRKINGLLKKLNLGYTVRKVEKSLLEKIMEKIMVKKSGGSVKDSIAKKLGIPVVMKASSSDIRKTMDLIEENKKRREESASKTGGSLKDSLAKKLGIPVVTRPTSNELRFVKEIEEINKKRRAESASKTGGKKRKPVSRKMKMYY